MLGRPRADTRRSPAGSGLPYSGSGRGKLPVIAVVLTKDETVNLRRTLPVNVAAFSEVLIVDSFSSDGTVEMAREFGAAVVQNEYAYPSQQINWALGAAKSSAQPWVLLLNADELPSEMLLRSMAQRLTADCQFAGFFLNFKVYFLGRWIRHGGYYPLWVVRLFRNGKGRCEGRKQDEKIIVEGPLGRLKGHLIDENQKGLEYFIAKHDQYAAREAADYLERRAGQAQGGIQPKALGDPAQRRRFYKSWYDRLPLFYRATAYYWFRMYLRLGVLDGREGRAFHFLQARWYRTLVDLKIVEQMRRAGPSASNDRNYRALADRVQGGEANADERPATE